MKIIRKVFINKKNKQMNVPLSKREFKKLDPTLKFSDNLFVEVKLVRGAMKGGKRK